jgi:hypothetical protein
MTIQKILLPLSFLFASAVAVQWKRAQSSILQRTEYKSIYIDQFKLTYFRQLLIRGYNDSKAVQEIIRLDHSGFTEPLLTPGDYQLIDSLTNMDNQAMRLDSARSAGRVAEGAEGKRILGFSLKKMTSEWLDSLAANRYRKSDVQ